MIYSDLFPESWYLPVPVKPTASKNIWINQRFHNEILTLKAEFDLFFSNKNKMTNDDLDFGIISALNQDSFIRNETEWLQYYNSVSYLKTERFFDPYNPDLGSSRGVIFKKGQWKGVGRNHASIRKTYQHNTGFMSYAETLYETIIDRVMEKYLPPNNFVPIYGVFTFVDYPSSYLLRSSNYIRCSQIPNSIRKEEILKVRKHLANKLSSNDINFWFKEAMLKTITSMSMGIFQTSTTGDNLTLDGACLDNGSIDWILPINGKFFFTTITLNETSKRMISQGDILDWKLIFSHQINEIETCYDYLLKSFNNLKDSYTNLKIPTVEWCYFKTIIKKLFSLPNDLDSDSFTTVLEEKLYLVKKFLEVEEKNGAKIFITPLRSGDYLISIGRSMHAELITLLNKLLSLATKNDGFVLSEDMKRILDCFFLKYDLPN